MRLPAALSNLLVRLGPWILPVAAVAGMGELVGGGWDIQWHIAQVPEVFWTPPHVVLYSGAGVVLLAAGAAFLLRWTGRAYPRPVRTGTAIAFAGVLLQFVAGGFDSGWHATFGADDSLSPPHVMLTGSMVLTAVGLVIALHAWRRMEETSGTRQNPASWIAHAVAATTLYWSSWGLLFILLFPGLNRMDVLVQPLGLRLFTGAAFAALLPMMVLASVRIVRHRGAATLTAGVHVLGSYTIGALLGALTPTALAFVPLLLAPGVVADLAYRPPRRGSDYVALVLGGILGGFGFLQTEVVLDMTRPDLVPVGMGLAFLAGGVAGALIAMALGNLADGLAKESATAMPSPAPGASRTEFK